MRNYEGPRRLFWQAPLVPVALAFTAGLLLDRLAPFPLPLALALTLVPLPLWLRRRGEGAVFLWLSVFFLGAAYHHYNQRLRHPDSLDRMPALEERPVRLQGRVTDLPERRPPPPATPLRSFPAPARTRFLLDCHSLQTTQGPVPARGQVQVWLEGAGPPPRAGDVIEIVGLLHFPDRPANPGGLDRSAQLGDQSILASLDVEGADAWHLLEPGSPTLRPSLFFSWLRQETGQLLGSFVPEEQGGLALALVLGDGSGMAGEDWEAYLQTGVIHALAISGQHLIILAVALGFLLRLGHVPRRRAGPAIALVLGGYALLTGGRPPILRATWMVASLVAATWLRRPPLPANIFALAWLGVALVLPGQLFQSGCLLSFLAVAFLIWGLPPVRPKDPIAELLAEQRPLPLTLALSLASFVATFFLANAMIWIAVTPLIASRMNLVSPVALLLGPPMVLFTTLALLTGFLTLFLGVLLPPLGIAFGWLTGFWLSLCQVFVAWGRDLPGAYAYVAQVNDAWLITFYIGLFAFLTLPGLRRRPIWFWSAALLWLTMGWLGQVWPRSENDFRCTFLAVGHGGCVVIEAPDGSVFLYDAGAMTGPDVTRRHIAPFLWERGIRRVDEVFLSHADLDHFNGLCALMDRFPVGRVTVTPSFADRSSKGVRLTLDVLRQRGIPRRVVQAGDRWEQGGLRLEVLHPPPEGPEGNENARSLVLLLQHQEMKILLTGDLEGPGLDQVLRLKSCPVDVMMAPHHGGLKANTPELAKWATPYLVVSCQGRAPAADKAPYPAPRYLTTWDHGAVTVFLDQGYKVAETFRTGKRWDWK